MANNRVWLVCRHHDPDPSGFTAPDNRWLISKHFVAGWQRRDSMEEIGPWLECHEECFFERSGVGTEQDPWDHQFKLEYED